MFLCISMLKTHDSQGLSHFGPLGIHLNKVGKGLLGNTTYQILKTLSQVVLKKKIFEYFLCISMVPVFPGPSGDDF